MLSLTKKVLEAVNKAREFFEIKDFPGNFFAHIEDGDYSSEYRLILFREDIDKLSGFVGYGENSIAAICINYKRSIGHQNFTLAHEIGHWIMHKGQNISDDVIAVWNGDDEKEIEASEFARELLYPEQFLVNDYYAAIQKDLFSKKNRNKLGKYIDELSHKYCVSFELVLRCLLYKNRQAKQFSTIKREIEKALGCKISEAFNRDFYVPNDALPEYRRYMKPYEQLETNVNKLVENNKIGKATGDAIILRNGVKDN